MTQARNPDRNSSRSVSAALGAALFLFGAAAVMSSVAAAPLDAGATAAQARNWNMRNGQLIERTWGVEVLGVHLMSSHWMLGFRYRVVDPDKARVVLDAKSTAYLVDEASGARLAVPAMENIGDLRQTRPANGILPGREYYILFGNGSQVVQKGGKVDVVIGGFHADGLVVQ